jgi:anti-anti-sigma factor
MNYMVKIIKKPVLQIRVRGEVLGQHGKKLRDALEAARALADDFAVLDLSGVTFVDSSGLGLFLHAWKEWQEYKCRLIFLVPEGFVRSTFEETNLIKQLDCIGSIKEL